jgi:hypothetical protein
VAIRCAVDAGAADAGAVEPLAFRSLEVLEVLEVEHMAVPRLRPPNEAKNTTRATRFLRMDGPPGEGDRMLLRLGCLRRVVSFDSVPANHGNIFDEPNV